MDGLLRALNDLLRGRTAVEIRTSVQGTRQIVVVPVQKS